MSSRDAPSAGLAAQVQDLRRAASLVSESRSELPGTPIASLFGGSSIREVIMRYFIWNLVGVLALLVLPFAGCSDSTNEGAGGSGGDAGAGGTAGTGGMAGTGGSEPAPIGLWTGSGQGGADGSFTVCFNVREDGLALVPSLDVNPGCEGHSFAIEFDDCAGALLTGEEVHRQRGLPSVQGRRGCNGGVLGHHWDHRRRRRIW